MYGSRLSFLSGYAQFHALFRDGKKREAAQTLVMMLNKEIVPRWWWGVVLLDATGMCEGTFIMRGSSFAQLMTFSCNAFGLLFRRGIVVRRGGRLRPTTARRRDLHQIGTGQWIRLSRRSGEDHESRPEQGVCWEARKHVNDRGPFTGNQAVGSSETVASPISGQDIYSKSNVDLYIIGYQVDLNVPGFKALVCIHLDVCL